MSSSQSTPRLIALVALAAAAGVVGLIATDRLPSFGREDANARQLLARALTDDTGGRGSGRFTGNLAMRIDGAPAQVGAVSMQVTGAFSGGATTTQRKVALDATMKFAGDSVGFGAVAIGRRAFFRFGSSHYEIPRSQLRQATDESTTGVLGSLGVDPRNWLDGSKDEGTADVGGVATQHVSADLNIARIVDDLLAVARKVDPNLPQDDVNDANEFKDAVKDARVDAYVGKADGVLRRVTMTARMEAGNGSGKIDADFTISEVGKPQRISTPANARPFSQLQSDLGVGGFENVLRQGAAPAPGTGSAPPPTADSSAPRSKAPSGDDQSYLGCVRRATTAAALQRCSSRLP